MKSLERFWLTLVALGCCLPIPVWAQKNNDDLTKQSLADLMNIEVTSVSKKEEKLSQTASAVFVITEDDIRRSSATSIPGLLRMVPGLQVAQINASTWAISARGFNGQDSNKLLVLVDGRTVYSPLFSGVFWDTQDVPLETIERIEVIRGPGATIWGANAVNGVINITTKAARDTQGKMLVTAGGDPHLGLGVIRYGSRLGASSYYRLSVDGFVNNHFPNVDGSSGHDEWHLINGTFHLDTNPSTKDTVTVQGGVHNGAAGEEEVAVISIVPPVNGTLLAEDHLSGWNVLSGWNHAFSPHSNTSLQTYFMHSNRGDTTYGLGLNTFSLEFENHLHWGRRQDIVWGAGYRLDSDRTALGLRYSFVPASLTTQFFSFFAQDEVALVSNRVHVSVGSKIEHNYFTGFGLEPSARVSWKVTSRSMVWAAVSQAERTPARTDTGLRLDFEVLPNPNGPPILLKVFGNPKFQNENLHAAEAGGRMQMTHNFSVDVAAYFNSYRQLASYEPGAPYLQPGSSPPYLVVPETFGNLLRGDTYGGEVFANWQVIKRWSLSPGYSFLSMHIHAAATSHDTTTAAATNGGSPNQQAQLRSRVDLPERWEWNTAAYFVGRLPAVQVPSYTQVDSNLNWRATKHFSFTLAGENLLKGRHLEYLGGDISVAPTLVTRGAYLKLRWQY